MLPADGGQRSFTSRSSWLVRVLEPFTWAKWGQLHPAVVCKIQQLLIHRVGLLHEFLSWQQMQKMKTYSVYPYLQSICKQQCTYKTNRQLFLQTAMKSWHFSILMENLKKKIPSNNYKKRKSEVENFSIAFLKLWPSPTCIGLKLVLHI